MIEDKTWQTKGMKMYITLLYTRNLIKGKDVGQFPIQSAQILTACG